MRAIDNALSFSDIRIELIPTHIEAFAAAIAFWSFLLFNWSNFRFAMFY